MNNDTPADAVNVWCHQKVTLGFRGEPVMRKVGLSFLGDDDDDARMFDPKEALKVASRIRRIALKARGGRS